MFCPAVSGGAGDEENDPEGSDPSPACMRACPEFQSMVGRMPEADGCCNAAQTEYIGANCAGPSCYLTDAGCSALRTAFSSVAVGQEGGYREAHDTMSQQCGGGKSTTS